MSTPINTLAHPAKAWKRFQKRRADRPVKVPFKIGSQIIIMDGRTPLAHLVLAEVEFGMHTGASARFIDVSHMLAAREMHLFGLNDVSVPAPRWPKDGGDNG